MCVAHGIGPWTRRWAGTVPPVDLARGVDVLGPASQDPAPALWPGDLTGLLFRKPVRRDVGSPVKGSVVDAALAPALVAGGTRLAFFYGSRKRQVAVSLHPEVRQGLAGVAVRREQNAGGLEET